MRRFPLSSVWFALRIIQVRLRFIALLVATGLIIGYWDHVENWYDKLTRPAATGTQAASAAFEYFCPMHTFIVRDAPGKCPICGMPLTKRPKSSGAKEAAGGVSRVQVAPNRVAEAGVSVEPVMARILVREFRSVGVVDFDERSVVRATARFPGRIEKVLVNYTGASVRRGDPLLVVYSPKYFSAAQEFLQALLSLRSLGPSASADDRQRAEKLVDYARERLELAGFEPSQIEEIEKTGRVSEKLTYYSKISGIVVKKDAFEGAYVNEGDPLYTVADLTHVWVQLQVPESDSGMVHAGMPVAMTTTAYPGETFYGNLSFVAPVVEASTRSVAARVEMSNPDGRLRPGMYVMATLRAPIGRAEPVAESETSAVLAAWRQHRQRSESALTHYTCVMCPEVRSATPGDCPKCGMKLVPATSHEAHSTTSSVGGSSGTAQSAVEYTCVMHPEVRSATPGDCPKCGMKLVPVSKPASPADSQAAQETIDFEKWDIGYTCEMHPEVLREQPGICDVCACKMPTRLWRVEKVLSVPESAIIDTGTRKIVYVELASGIYEMREVTVGPRAGDYYPVVRGLSVGERVVVHGSFLIDAENRLSGTAPPLEGAEASASPAADSGSPAKESSPPSSTQHRH